MSYILIIFKSLLDRKVICDKYVVLQMFTFFFSINPLCHQFLLQNRPIYVLYPLLPLHKETYLLHCYLETWTSSSGPSIHYKQKKIYRFHKNIKTDDTRVIRSLDSLVIFTIHVTRNSFLPVFSNKSYHSTEI